MSCSDRVTLQEYLDQELAESLALKVRVHLKECEKCRNMLEELTSDRDQVFEFLSQVDIPAEPNPIPDPTISAGPENGGFHWMRRSNLLKAAAGIVLLLGVFLIHRYSSVSGSRSLSEAELMYMELIGIAEPNKSWHNGQTLIVLSDEEGEVIEAVSNTD